MRLDQNVEHCTNVGAAPAPVRAFSDGILLEHRALAEAIARLSATLDTLRSADSLFSSSVLPSGPRSAGVLPEQSANGSPRIAWYCLGAFELSGCGPPVETCRRGNPRTPLPYHAR